MASKQYMRIVGETVQVITETVERVVMLDDFMTKYNNSVGVQSPLLPTGCRLWRKYGNKQTFLFEEPPRVRTVNWTWWPEGDIDHRLHPVAGRYALALPYVVFVVRTVDEAIHSDGCQVFFRTAPLSGEEHTLCAPALPNVCLPEPTRPGRSCRICFGNARAEPGAQNTLLGRVAAIPQAFWGSEFNTDLRDNLYVLSGQDARFLSPHSYAAASAADPLFPLGVTNYNNACTLKEAMLWLP